MIISASRRTDIPAWYGEWFMERIREGFVCVENPFNLRQISRIPLTPEVVDCIVFWSKNPGPMIPLLDELKGYEFYFQFTLTGYGRDIEPGLPDKRRVLIPVFQKLSEKIGCERVIWRYDPILINGRYSLEYHRKAFGEIAGCLRGYTKRVVISFLDSYRKIEKNLEKQGVLWPSEEEMAGLAAEIAGMARENQMEIVSCGEKMDLQPWGIGHGSCVDKGWIERLTGCRLEGGKDKNQRAECGCMESIDIGGYDTCRTGCIYCYANQNRDMVRKKAGNYRVGSEVLCRSIGREDVVTDRKVKSLKILQEVLTCEAVVHPV